MKDLRNVPYQHGAWGVWVWWFGSQSLLQTSGSTRWLSATDLVSAQSAGLLTYLRVIEAKGLQTRVPTDQPGRWHQVQEWVNGCSCEVESVDTVFWEHYNVRTLEAKRGWHEVRGARVLHGQTSAS